MTTTPGEGSSDAHPVITAEQAMGEEPGPVLDPVLLGGNELTTNSLGEYFAATLKRIRNGESGILPVVVGLVLIVVIFQTQNSKFLSAANLVNLLDQSSYIIVFGMAEVFLLLLGEIDLSISFNGAVGAVVTLELAAAPHNVNWLPAILAGLATCVVISTTIGLIVTRLKVPSFIVTLAYFLGLQGVILYLINHDTHASGGSIDITVPSVLNNIVNGNLSATVTWIITIAAVALFGVVSLFGDIRRRRSGLVTPPLALTVLKVAGVAVAGLVVALIYNHNRGLAIPLKGMHWDIPIIVVLLALYTFLLNRTRFGRYMYAIGGNAEAARRAGISLNRIRLTAFMLAGFTAGIGGIILASFLGSQSSASDGGTNVLYAVAAAVIGGTSLLGGRGKMIHAALGGLIIGAIANGMSLIQLGPDAQYMVTGLVLLAAVTIDALARRRAIAT